MKSTAEAVNRQLDILESLLIGLHQRQLDPEQTERLARLLQGSERGLIGKLCQPVRVTGGWLHSLSCEGFHAT